MNDDTIKRSDAIKAVSKVDDYGDGIGFEVRSHCLVELELVPSADKPQEDYNRGYCDAVQGIADEMVKQGKCIVQDRQQGEWIDRGEYAECSICGADSGTQFDGVEPVPRKTKFCPNCGARMKGADDGKECHKPESEYYRAYCEERKEKTYCKGCKYWY